MNPKGEVPYFIDGELKLGQSMAILSYIDEKWPSNPLFPKDLGLRSKCIQLSEVINSGICFRANYKMTNIGTFYRFLCKNKVNVDEMT